MPVISPSSYQRPFFLFNGHLETVYPAIFRNVNSIPPFERERISTPDDDFLDLDWLRADSKKLLVISHGLEGDSQRPYMRGMASTFFNDNWDVLAWNFRTCSGEMNLSKTMYHSGFTADLETVVKHAIGKGYEEITLVGFSLGGNLTLKYLGEEQSHKHPEIKSAVVISVPFHLNSSGKMLAQPENILYVRRFLKSLKKKALEKEKQFPGMINIDALNSIHSIFDFDDMITAPLNGFEGAEDYYTRCSGRNFLNSIKIRTLVVNAMNDSFLSTECLDHSLFENLENVYIETPEHGGHVGFSMFDGTEQYWSEKRAIEFVNDERE
ncbi:MAG: alpha/beta fold hydrolase [Cyclobacteriaceae bacterium]